MFQTALEYRNSALTTYWFKTIIGVV